MLYGPAVDLSRLNTLRSTKTAFVILKITNSTPVYLYGGLPEVLF